MAPAPKIDAQAQIFDDVVMTEDRTSTVINLTAYRHFAMHALWTGTPVGNLQLQVSNDGTNWFDQGSPVAAGGVAGSTMFSEEFAPWAYARLFFDFSSSTGVLNAFSIIKE